MNIVKGLSKEILKLLKQTQFIARKAVYAEKKKLTIVPAGAWALKTINVEARGAAPAFTGKLCQFEVEGLDGPVEVFFRSGQKPDEAEDVKISLYEATDDYTCDNGKVIHKGDKRTYAVMA